MARIRGRHHEAQASPTILLFMFLFFNFQTLLQATQDQLELLLSFKSSINDPLHYLSNWNPSVTFCKWQGITCNNSNSFHVDSVDLSGKNISGRLTPSIFQLPYVKTIDLSNNQLSGNLPHDMFSISMSSVLHLNLSNNNFTGPIPNGFISSLETLDLSNNMLSGKFPPQIGSFSSLKFLDLGGNVLVGEIPISITNLTKLQVFTLASNQLTGRIPQGIGLMRSLKWVYLGYNNFSCEIPSQIGDLTGLNHLDLVYNNLTGPIPTTFGNLTNLQFLFLYQNKLTGSIPTSIFCLRNLISLDLSDNALSGEISELVIQLQNLEILHLFSNNFTGIIPAALSSLPRLQVLQLWSNNFSGEIPKDLGKNNNLTVLDLSTNSLAGKIPESLCSSGNLFKLILFSNMIEGEIPGSLSTCKSLKRVRLQNNKLSGELNAEFTKLPLVYFLDLSSNNLSGRIDTATWNMPSLQMLSLARNRFFGDLPDSFGSEKLENLDLSENGFSGTIPPSFAKLSELMQLKLGENKLSGEIPPELSSCKKLVSLDLSHNQIRGEIPYSFSEMPVLGQLDLSENQLSGLIPGNLGRVESLVKVNISHNHFHGRLPSTGAFLAINATAVAGNDNLCGSDTTSRLPPCGGAKGRPMWWVLAVSVLGALLLLSLISSGIIFVRGRRNSVLKRVENEDGIWELQLFHPKISKLISVEDVLLSVKEEKGKSVANDVPFFVKGISDLSSIPPRFWSEISEFGKLQHPNIVKLIGICRSNNKGAYLIYEYIQGKNLNEVLRNFDWERRRKIAMGISKALRFLHFSCSPSVLVGNMSPERIIVDGNDEPHLKLSLPYQRCVDDNKFYISSAYVAPETRETKDTTEKSDIYGFGLILIKLLTGKSLGDPEFGVHESIIEWARYCYSDCHLDTWIDPIMKEHASINQNVIVQTMNLALHCTATDPSARPSAIEVSKNLESAFRSTSSGLKFSRFLFLIN